MPEAFRQTKKSGSKSYKPPGAVSRKRKRQRNLALQPARKDLHVRKSSHGKFLTVAALMKTNPQGYTPRQPT